MPADDPASHRYMHCVDGMEGWKHWGDYGVRSALENPQCWNEMTTARHGFSTNAVDEILSSRGIRCKKDCEPYRGRLSSGDCS